MELTRLKQLFTDEDAVSPVIGVILMVAITVILAAVIGTFVLGLGENVQDSAPQANFQFEYDTTAGTVDITHTGGEDVAAENVVVQDSTGHTEDANSFGTWADTIETGDTENFDYDAGADDIRVIWTSPSGSNSNTIGQSTIPS